MRAVIDTNVVVEGLGRRDDCGRVIDLWVARRFEPCVSTSLALEYEAVLTRGRTEENRERMQKVLQALLLRATYVPVAFVCRGQSPDPDDDCIIECAMNAGAMLVTANRRHFAAASRRLGFSLVSPGEFVAAFEEEG